MAELNEKNTLKIALDFGKGILVESSGDPAKIVAFGAAIALIISSAAIGYTVHTVRHIFRTKDATILDSKNQT